MLIRRSKKVKTITATNAFDFDTALNAFTDGLDRQGIAYTLSVKPEAGLLAFVEYEVETRLPQNAKDEYELLGETHKCIECPFYVRPTDGRVVYTHCLLVKSEVDRTVGRLTSADSDCCEQFYERLKRGMSLTNVGKERWSE